MSGSIPLHRSDVGPKEGIGVGRTVGLGVDGLDPVVGLVGLGGLVRGLDLEELEEDESEDE